MLHLFVNDRYPKKFPSDHCVWKILLPEIYEIDFLMSRERHTRVHFVTQLFTNHKILVVLLLVTCVVTCRDFSFYLLISLKINSARCCIIATWTIFLFLFFCQLLTSWNKKGRIFRMLPRGQRKKSESPTGLEPMTFHTLVGCCNHWARYILGDGWAWSYWLGSWWNASCCHLQCKYGICKLLGW